MKSVLLLLLKKVLILLIICDILKEIKAEQEKVQNIRAGVAKIYGYPRIGRSGDEKVPDFSSWNQYYSSLPYEVTYPLEMGNEFQNRKQYLDYFGIGAKRAGGVMVTFPRIGRSENEFQRKWTPSNEWNHYAKEKRGEDSSKNPTISGLWFGPRLGKRNDYPYLDSNSIMETSAEI